MQHGFYARSLRDHLRTLATGDGIGTILLIQSLASFTAETQHLPLGDLPYGISAQGLVYHHRRWHRLPMARSRSPTYSQALAENGGLVVTVQTEIDPLCILRVALNCTRSDNWKLTNNNSVVPSNVAAYIRVALADGWQPNFPGSAFEMDAELEM